MQAKTKGGEERRQQERYKNRGAPAKIELACSSGHPKALDGGGLVGRDSRECVCVCVCMCVCVCGCVCVWKYSTVWEESRAIWQVLNLLAPTKEMPASGIHHCVLYTHRHTHTLSLTAIISYLFSFGVEVLEVLVHITTCVPATNTDLKERSVYN